MLPHLSTTPYLILALQGAVSGFAPSVVIPLLIITGGVTFTESAMVDILADQLLFVSAKMFLVYV